GRLPGSRQEASGDSAPQREHRVAEPHGPGGVSEYLCKAIEVRRIETRELSINEEGRNAGKNKDRKVPSAFSCLPAFLIVSVDLLRWFVISIFSSFGFAT